MNGAFATLGYLARKGSWSVLDQALFAGANAVLSVILARTIGPEGFGAYALAYSVYLLLYPLHGAMLVEPMLVFGAGRYRSSWPRYLRWVLLGHLATSIVAVLVLLAAWFVLTRWLALGLGDAGLMLVAAAPLMLFQMLMRRACYAVHRPHLAAAAGVAYFVLVLSGALLLAESGSLSAGSALLLMGVAGLVSVLGLAPVLGVHLPSGAEPGFARAVVSQHLQYGRWAVGYRLLRWVPRNLAYFVLPFVGSLGAAGTLRAMEVVFMPLTQANAAFSAIVLPNLVASRRTGRFMQRVWLVFGTLVFGAICYAIAVGAGGSWLLSLLYGDAYAEAGWILWILGLGAVAGVARELLSAAMRALERPDAVFMTELMVTAVFIVVGAVAIGAYGLAGAAFAMAIPALLQSGLLARVLLRWGPVTPQAPGLAEGAAGEKSRA